MSVYANFLLEKDHGIGIATINRPKVLNALNSEALNELGKIFDELAGDDQVKVVIVTGSGDKSFCVGWDIPSMQLPMSVIEGRNWAKTGQAIFNRIENLPQPVIAVINGFALGVGCELAMACDIRIASNKAKFSQPEVSIGMTPGFGGTQRLARLVGKGRAKELMFTCDVIDAQEAHRIGLINKVAAPDELMDAAKAMAQKIISQAPIAVQLCKTAVNNGLDADFKTGQAYESELFALCFATEDQIEGISAFREKRKANFKGN